MSDLDQAPLPLATVTRLPPQGMVALRGDLGSATLARALAETTGCALPGQRRITRAGGNACAWMSPDELLIFCPHAGAATLTGRLAKALADQHASLADMSEARVLFTVEGARSHEVLMKLTPADVERLEPDEFRRSRAAQVAAAFWRDGDGFRLMVMRSVGDYAEALLRRSAAPGGELF